MAQFVFNIYKDKEIAVFFGVAKKMADLREPGFMI